MQESASTLVFSRLPLPEIAQRLRDEFDLSPGDTLLALRQAGIPLAIGKQAVDRSLTQDEREVTDAVRDTAAQSLDPD